MRLFRTLGIGVLVAATGWVQPDALVLCVSPGWHVAIESGQDRCIAPDGPTRQEHGSSFAGLTCADACCTPCADLPIGSSEFVRAGGSRDEVHELKVPAAVVTVATAPAWLANVADGIRTVSPGGEVCQSTPVLQTVILRC